VPEAVSPGVLRAAPDLRTLSPGLPLRGRTVWRQTGDGPPELVAVMPPRDDGSDRRDRYQLARSLGRWLELVLLALLVALVTFVAWLALR